MVSGQLHALIVLPLEKEPQEPIYSEEKLFSIHTISPSSIIIIIGKQLSNKSLEYEYVYYSSIVRAIRNYN
jgi:hypothetical protein